MTKRKVSSSYSFVLNDKGVLYMVFPECIKKHITDLSYEINDVGMSQSSVFVFES